MSACREYQGTRAHGYGYIMVGPPKGRHSKRLHRWVMEQALGRELARDEFVLHSCDNRACFLLEHLRVGTHADNMRDRQERGRTARGETHGSHTHPERFPGRTFTEGRTTGYFARGSDLPHTKLTETQVMIIKRLMRAGVSQYALARQYGVSRSTIAQIAQGRAWRWVT